MKKSSNQALFIGLQAAKANLIPGLIIQAVMLAIVLAYYWNESTRGWLNELAQLKAHFGYLFSVPLGMFVGALLPEMLKVLVFQRGRVRRQNFESFVFAALFWGFAGGCVDSLYRLQTLLFGNIPTFSVIVSKVLVDQFIYNPVWGAPITVWAYEWRDRGFTTVGIAEFFTLGFYREQIVPVLLATWGVWIPVMILIYSLPPLLQVPLFGLALCFWVLLVTSISAGKQSG